MKARELFLLSPEELMLLRASPYESPSIVTKTNRRDRRMAMHLVALGFLEQDNEAGTHFRCTDAGADQARVLTPNEASRHAREILARVESGESKAETYQRELLARACAEVEAADWADWAEPARRASAREAARATCAIVARLVAKIGY